VTITGDRRNCVILYSRRHFDPGKDTDLSASSAGQIARAIYEAVQSLPGVEVNYFDCFNHNEWKPIKTDILITIVDNLSLARWYFQPNRTFVIAVNHHPLERLRISSQALNEGLPSDALVPSDGIYQSYQGLTKVDGILCIGNQRTLDSYTKYIRDCNIVLSSYQSFFSSARTPKRGVREIRNVLILMSSIGYRKGFDQIYNSLVREKELLKEYNFHIIGHPEGRYWSKLVSELEEELDNVTFHGWVINSTSRFAELLSQTDVALFPTREEGLVGSLIECIDNGILSLHTVNSGLNNSAELLTLPNYGELRLGEKLKSIRVLDRETLVDLVTNQAREMHTQFKSNPTISIQIKKSIMNASPRSSSRHNWLKILQSVTQILRSKPITILLVRFRWTTVRKFKARIELKYPRLYLAIRQTQNKVIRASN
jgi:glycosyltransferase involved in cell wall biosynthesis